MNNLKSIVSNISSQEWVKYLLKFCNVYLVGGCVRDSIMNIDAKDIDIVVEGLDIFSVKELLKHYGKTNIVGQSFSVIKFASNDNPDVYFDIAVPRIDIKTGSGHKGFKVKTNGVTIKDDLRRRDFTINSIAVNIKTKEILDPFNGIRDINQNILRATDERSFVEDPLRIVRGIQFASRFHFTIEPTTLQLMKNNCKLIKEISGERIKEEFDKILNKGGSTKIALELIEKSDLDKGLFDKKFSNKDFENFDNLDIVSFYYILSFLGDKDPVKFYRDRLKGEAEIVKALDTFEKYFERFSEDKSEEEVRWNVFVMLKTSPILQNVKILPLRAKKIIKMMKDGIIPMKLGDIPVNGVDLMNNFPIGAGEELGGAIQFMYKEALINKFNWKDKDETINYLKTL